MSGASGSARPEMVRVRFVDQLAPGDTCLAAFGSPQPGYAVLADGGPGSTPPAAGGSYLDVTLFDPAHADTAAVEELAARWAQAAEPGHAPPPVLVLLRDAAAAWRPGEAALLCSPAQRTPLLKALAEFARLEAALRAMETALLPLWAELEEDKSLAFDVKARDLKRSGTLQARIAGILQLRVQLARAQPGLLAAAGGPTPGSRRLGRRLRAAAGLEARAEALDSQLAVFEGVYEMASQRMGEARAAHESLVVEWIIVALLAGEVVIALVTLLRSGHL